MLALCELTYARGPSARGVKKFFSLKHAQNGETNLLLESSRLGWVPCSISVSLSRCVHRKLHLRRIPHRVLYIKSIMPSAIAIPCAQSGSTPNPAAVPHSHSCSAAHCGHSSARLHTLPPTCNGTKPLCLTGRQGSGGRYKGAREQKGQTVAVRFCGRQAAGSERERKRAESRSHLS